MLVKSMSYSKMSKKMLNNNAAVFLDRDGVLNQVILKQGKPYPPSSVAEMQLLPGVKEALDRLKKHGFLLMVVTNQPDVARGTTTRAVVEAINQYLVQNLPLDDVLVCYHDDQDYCECRKPKPGLLKQAAEKYQINLDKSFMIGDRWRDIQAGQAAGCRTIWIDNHYQEPAPKDPDFTTSSLLLAANWICNHERGSL